MSFPRYDSYKHSGIDWLAEVPKHWDCLPLRRLSTLTTGLTPPTDNPENYVDEGGLPWIRPEDIDELGAPTQASKFLSETGWKLVRKVAPFSSLVCCIGTIGKIGFVTHTVSTNQQITSVEFKRSSRYFYYALVAARAELETRSTGNVLRILNSERLGNTVLPLPPRDEAAGIVAFLDRETGKIDALVEEQKLVIALLKEKRQAAISHAVTKGLNPDAPMKPSGIEWLGEVPAHWEVKRLKDVCAFSSGKAHEPYFDEDGKYICVTARFVSTQGASRRFCTDNLSPARKDDILMVMSDLPNGRALAKAFIADDEIYAVNQRVCAITVRQGNPRFFYYQLDRNEQLLRYDDGVEQTHLSNDSFRKLLLFAPPRQEQDAIAALLDENLAMLDRLSEDIDAAITLLQERRSALISAAVTGKIDVRGLVPDQAEAA